jgi:hypothetical protein
MQRAVLQTQVNTLRWRGVTWAAIGSASAYLGRPEIASPELTPDY